MSECIISKQDVSGVANRQKSATPPIRSSRRPRFVGLVSNRGRIIRSSHDSMTSLDKHNQEMFFTEIALQTRMHADFDEYFDSVRYSLTERGETKIVTIPLPGFETIIVILDKHLDHNQIVEKIRNALTTDAKNFDFNYLLEKEMGL